MKKIETEILEGDELKMFKINYIENFLELESTIEKVILNFFKSGNTDKDTKRKNFYVEHYWRSTMFSHRNFGFSEKLISYELIIEMLYPKLYDLMTKQKVFEILIKLANARNLIAHNRTHYNLDGNPSVVKHNQKILSIENYLMERNGEPNYGLHFVINVTHKTFDKEICLKMNQQLKFVSNIILHTNSLVLKWNLKANNENGSLIYMLNKMNKYQDDGVHLFVKATEDREKTIQEAQKKRENDIKTAKQLEAEEKNKLKRFNHKKKDN